MPIDEVIEAASAEIIRRALDAMAATGRFFELSNAPQDGADWRPTARLYAISEIGDLSGVLSRMRVSLSWTEERVAASVFHLGYASRLLSPALGSAALYGHLPDLRQSNVLWRPTATGSVEIALRRTRGWSGSYPGVLGQAMDLVLTEHLEPLERALLRHVKLPSGLLRGNVASAAIGTLNMVRPMLGLTWLQMVEATLGPRGLAGAGTFSGPDLRYIRRSCCLLYRAGGGTCTDCPLRTSAAARQARGGR
ncbi:MAG TPA: (2Fe-2S)-binding protein [Streptosporangiaceae bacterium]|nr:(2Fe-2S)-binding protein [Streptosporangiaceae bacterium]